ncbi:hypothetical protein RCCGEPOP_09139 [Rhizobium sp. Pop5]|nr:hypothetical protein RCCGEPOP_09139 [Rhizobium sp. Pop5]
MRRTMPLISPAKSDESSGREQARNAGKEDAMEPTYSHFAYSADGHAMWRFSINSHPVHSI